MEASSISYKKINKSEMPDLHYKKKEGRKDFEYDEEQGGSLWKGDYPCIYALPFLLNF